MPKDRLEGNNDRIGHVVQLLASQESTTWTITTISFAGQLVLLGFYFQSGVTGTGREVIATMGALIGAGFFLLVRRSNRYMVHYMGLLEETGRPEFAPLPLFHIATEKPEAASSEAPAPAENEGPSAQDVLNAFHGLFIGFWILLALLQAYGISLATLP